ncbi:d-alanine--poly(Phosphoribitol) ligase subunit 2 [Clostridium sp. CAG:1219]|nr:d-alanine--poly(Phosphoribitol) ligase subunit 2 [Clostridium sp. CAG:1219]
MEKKIISIICEICGSDEVRKNKNIDLLAEDVLDSMAFIELVQRLEDEFDIEIQPTEEKPSTWRNVKNISEMVEEKLRSE